MYQIKVIGTDRNIANKDCPWTILEPWEQKIYYGVTETELKKGRIIDKPEQPELVQCGQQ
jgi:hypothetical protein